MAVAFITGKYYKHTAEEWCGKLVSIDVSRSEAVLYVDGDGHKIADTADLEPEKTPYSATIYLNAFCQDGELQLKGPYESRAQADKIAGPLAGKREACIKVEVEFEEGQFDD